MGCEVVENPKKTLKYFGNILRYTSTLLNQYHRNERVHVFIFRYLNDSKHLRVSLKYLIRDLLTILVCKTFNTKIIWLLHNINEETKSHYPMISKLRRMVVSSASERVLVTDPHLMEYALDYGINEEKLDWICFGTPERFAPDKSNIELRDRIEAFKEKFYKKGVKNVVVGLCVSEPAKKKAHYLYADSVVGMCRNHEDTCVVLVMVGKYPDGEKYQQARQRVENSPFILYIEEAFPVNEMYIADLIDFFYRSLADHSVAYTLYVACDLNKPVITHNVGALPIIVEREKIGFVVHGSIEDTSNITVALSAWNSDGSKQFLKERNWETAAKRLVNNIHMMGIQT